jgi:RNA-directed DNA polymerase
MQLSNRRDVAALLELPLPELTWLVFALRPSRRYRRFEIDRSNGTKRTIQAPIKPLKEVQRRLVDRLTEIYEPPSHVHGFVRQRSPISNARVHRGREWVLRVDLTDFFPSINFGRVRGLFMAGPFNFAPDAATLLAQICCFDGALPQGAPTSPIVSNLICRSLDRDLFHLARGERCSVTRYADDLCFSTERTYFPHDLAYIDGSRTIAGAVLQATIESNGFAVNADKSRLMRRTQRQRVTGLVVNEKTNVSRDYVRDVRNLLYIWRRHGENDAIAAWRRQGRPRNWPPGKPTSDFAQVVRGRVQYIGSIRGWTSSSYLGLAATLEELDSGFVLKHEAPPPGPAAPPAPRIQVRLLTEGKTDIKHMLAAQRHFHREGDFTGFELVTDGSSDRKGYLNLLRSCEGLAMTPQPGPCIGLFDRDNETILETATEAGEPKDWGHGVVSLALVGHGDDRICIEMLYDQHAREVEDEEGRRMFLMSEFDPATGHHESGPFNVIHPNKKKLLPDNVYAMADARSIGLTKDDFATAVFEATGDFAGVSFEGFRGTFEAIQQAIPMAVQGAATS